MFSFIFTALVHGNARGTAEASGIQENCPAGWVEFQNNCYLLTDTNLDELSWHDANAKCLSDGAQLASINSEEEKQFIEDTVSLLREDSLLN